MNKDTVYPSLRYRLFLGALTAGVWLLAFWLASHQNTVPVIFGRYSTAWFGLLLVLFAAALGLTWSWMRGTESRLYRLRHSLLLLGVTSVVSLALVEVTLRLVDPLGISYYAEAKRYHLDKLADVDLYFKHRPGLDEDFQGVRVTTNSLGLRERELGSPAEGERRILFLGDSVTFGWGVEIEDTFVRRVGELLSERLGTTVTTINSGVGGYNTTSEYAFLQRHGDALRPDLVVLTYIVNDFEYTLGKTFDPWKSYAFAGKSPPEKIRLLLGQSWLYRLVSHIGQYASGDPAAAPVDTNGAGWRESERALLGIRQYCRERDIPLAVFLFRMSPAEPGDSLAVELERLAIEHDFLFTDLLDAFAGREPRALINSVVDAHPNAAGHAITASAMADFIEQNGLPGTAR